MMDRQQEEDEEDTALLLDQTEKQCFTINTGAQNAVIIVISSRQNQVILLDTLEQEVTKFRECNATIDLNTLFTEATVYHRKLVNIRREMIVLHDKTTRLKKRALKLQQHKQEEDLEREQKKERELERERHLIAKPAKRSDAEPH
ncbi:biogenesis of lysosome-related organelles complex 1 subunit 6-like [Sinocyclocheilus rhinocerous]|uniref:biogenesis of lysosome-related organelles complex 1 subunit 6-like n=1 Tax=Sinocyclocheilus rhinocerous TaxID=307959 RepID=UPI0007B84A86|nr:PREDICTED: biogenesis of lysosome-related organelles complex 1 subunit 6-like [Sinocyclocheilus rhinocerous]